jgi:hypothetical protein
VIASIKAAVATVACSILFILRPRERILRDCRRGAGRAPAVAGRSAVP